MAVIFGLLTFIIGVAIPVAITYFTGFEVIHFSLFFVVPVGALIVGYISGFGFFKGLVKSNTQITGKHYLIGFIISLLCVFSIEYLIYEMTCIDENTMELYYSFDGGSDHISNYDVPDYGIMTFANYKKFMIETTPISFSHRTREIGEIANPIVGWVFAIIDSLGITVGYLYNGLSQGSRAYCKNCRKYKDESDFTMIPIERGEDFFKLLEDASKSEIAFTELISRYDVTEVDPKKDEHFKGIVVYCDDCRDASIKFELYKKDSDGDVSVSIDFDLELPVEYTVVKRYIRKSA